MFDPPEKVPYAQTPDSEIDSAAHRELALKTARESIVLLKNDGVLPFGPKIARDRGRWPARRNRSECCTATTAERLREPSPHWRAFESNLARPR